MEIAAFSYQQGKKIWDTVQTSNSVRRPPESSAGGVTFLYNQPFVLDPDTPESVPAYAVMEVSGYVQVGDLTMPTVRKPRNDTSSLIMLNGPAAVFNGDVGAGTFGTGGVAYNVLCGTRDDMEQGMPLGLRDEQWYLERGGGFAEVVAAASEDIAPDLVTVVLNQGSRSHILKTDSSGIEGRSGNAISHGQATPYWINEDGDLEELLDSNNQSQTIRVHHIGSTAIGGSAFIQAKTFNGRLVADFEDCGS